jgi:hypothetical protein
MQRSDLIAGAFAYAASEWGRWPKLTYLPLSREITFEPTTQVSIVYLGNVAWGLAGALCGACLGALRCLAVPRTWADRTLHLFGAWAITAILLAGGYFTWSLWPW